MTDEYGDEMTDDEARADPQRMEIHAEYQKRAQALLLANESLYRWMTRSRNNVKLWAEDST